MSKLFAYVAMELILLSVSFGCEASDPAQPGSSGAGGSGGFSCQAGQTQCGADCVLLSSNAAHCGACNNLCPAGTSCAGGACSCQAGLASCNGQCVDPTSDPANCGGCSVVCAPEQVCSLSACASECAAGLTQCGQSCVDTANNVLNCGACNNPCPGGRSCQAGACACERAGEVDCGGVCVDTQSDPGNCGGCGNICAAGAACTAGACAGATTTGGSSGAFINENARVAAADNSFGIQGDWYAFGDGVTSTESGNPWRDGAYCISGEAPGDEDFSAHWGAGIGLDLNSVGGEKLPYEFAGKINGFRMKIVGTAPTTPRVYMVNSLDTDVTPFIPATLEEISDYWIAEAQVPLEWGVDNAGARVDNGVLYSLQILAPGAEAAGPIDICLTEFEPVYDPNYMGPVVDDGPYINSDGFILADNNPYGIEGPVYVISDGNSTAQTGSPYQDGKYCVAGTFSGAADDWGAGIAFDLARSVGGEKQPFVHDGVIEGFRIGLSGSSPGFARIQFVTSEPQQGDQPFLRAMLNTSLGYRIDWAEVPTSWDVANAGEQVGDSVYTLQVYLEGDTPGPFEVCVDEFLPVTAAEIAVDAAPATSGFNAPRTVDPAVLDQEYAWWKARHFQDCGDGTACVPTGEGNCISEGIGYGMLITVGMDDQSAFDQIWGYFKKHTNNNGVMTWSTAACGAANDQGSATDGELDAAIALLQAGCKWGGNYAAEAATLIAAIKNSEVTTCNGKTVLKPGDMFGGCDETNPSYVAPAYYKAFEAVTGDSTWSNLASDGYALIGTLQDQMNGLVPDWCNADGVPQSGDRGEYGPDASRTPWRIATDYVWNGDERAVTVLDKVASYVESNGGVQRVFEPTSNYRGAFAMSGWQQASATAQAYTDGWLTTAVDDSNYYQGALRMVYLLLAAQQFQKPCN